MIVLTYIMYYSEVYEPLLNSIREATRVKILGRQLMATLPDHPMQLL